MAHKRLNPRLAKMHYSYSVEEIAALYSVHPNSVRQWLKTGLAAIDDARPLLVKGAELRRFIEERRASSKKPCPPERCTASGARSPARRLSGWRTFVERESGAGNLQALCDACGTLMCRRTRREKISAILPGVVVQFTRHPERIGE